MLVFIILQLVSRSCNSRGRFTTTVFRSGHKHYRPSAMRHGRKGGGVHVTKERSRYIYLRIFVCSLCPDDRKADFTTGAWGRDPSPFLQY